VRFSEMTGSPFRPQRSTPQSLTIPGQMISHFLSGSDLAGNRRDQLITNKPEARCHSVHLGVATMNWLSFGSELRQKTDG
jgi:hypothetical protein